MKYSDLEIIEGIRQKDSKVISYIYKSCYPTISHLIHSNAGNAEDVQDVFQDAMVVLYKKLKEDDFDLYCAFGTYLYSICKRLWLKKLTTRQKEEIAIKDIAHTVALS